MHKNSSRTSLWWEFSNVSRIIGRILNNQNDYYLNEIEITCRLMFVCHCLSSKTPLKSLSSKFVQTSHWRHVTSTPQRHLQTRDGVLSGCISWQVCNGGLFFQGMLEPTKEPVKPVSAAEMIASIAQAPPAAPEKSSCPSDTVQVGPLTHDTPDQGSTSAPLVFIEMQLIPIADNDPLLINTDKITDSFTVCIFF